ncbi:MAG TPA: 3-phosphoshikimate 1-carboxyvinyltransferase, partial [Polyangia bacterium]|nr:3-phosphoshikimate 1-carboxyvinyltransferase [Polyangia bacterium]
NASTAQALGALGASVRLEGERATVEGVGFEGLRAASGPIDCGNSGTTMRLLTGLVAGRPFVSTLEGDASLTRRPMGRVSKPMRFMGATITGRQGDPEKPNDLFPPLVVHGAALQGIDYDLPVPSAQLKSALLLAALQAKGIMRITEPGLSRDHSERMLKAMGAPVTVDAAQRLITVDPSGWNGKLTAGTLTVPGDLSSAAFLIVAALIVPGSDVTIENVGLNPTRTGLLDALAAMGADLTVTPEGEVLGEPVGRVTARASQLRATTIDGELSLRSIDEIPALAVAAARAQGQSTFVELHELRVKESDRIASIARELGRAGFEVEVLPDGFTVQGAPEAEVKGGTVDPEHDHRIAMAGAILGLVGGEETVVPAGDIGTSFPTFAETLRALGAKI